MDGPEDYHISEVRETEKDKYHMISHVWNLKKNDTKELNYKTEIVSKIQNWGYQREKVRRDKLGV